MARARAFSFAVLFLIGGCNSKPEEDPGQRGPSGRISRAAFFDGKVWIVREDGSLSSFSEEDEAPRVHRLGGATLDVCSDGRSLWAVTEGQKWTLHSWQSGRWTNVRQVDGGGDFLVSLGCGPEGPLLAMNRRLVEFNGSGETSTPLSKSIVPHELTPVDPASEPPLGIVMVIEEQALVGLDMGEWGGGLRRIDRRSGRVEVLEKMEGDLCEGALNTNCDRVQALVEIPWRSGCFAVAIDVGHGGHGRVTGVCQKQIEQLFAARDGVPQAIRNGEDNWRGGGFGSTPFLGAVASGQDLILASGQGLYRMGRGGVDYLGWPEFREVGDISVSFSVPGAVLIAQNTDSEYVRYDPVKLVPRPH